MIVSSTGVRVRVREARERRGWSQQTLAERTGLSRAGISAIETGRLVPSTAAALAIASAFESRVEDLFALSVLPEATVFAWEPSVFPARYWCARFGRRALLYPVEPMVAGAPPHDGLAGAAPPPIDAELAGRTLVVAGCDPAAGLLVSQAGAREHLRILALPRGSGEALQLLERGLVHLAGLHLGRSDPDGNVEQVRSRLGSDYSLLRLANWEIGVATSPTRRVSNLRGARRSRLRWIGREPGTGARQCQDEVLTGGEPPLHVARDHRGVAESIRIGFADAGVCPRLISEESNLRFLSVRKEAYDLCYPRAFADDWRLRALIDVVRSTDYRRLLGELPGHDPNGAGALREA